ncbi:MAG: hypothetical protein ACJAS1_004350 [Oleiphilaceae bacterium]|jgi:hypothetical protein
MNLKKHMTKYGMQTVLHLTSFFARRERLTFINKRLLGAAAKFVVKKSTLSHPQNLAELGRSWQNAFPSPKQVPLVNITEDTVYAEIRTPCPLRETGDLNACYRMMEFDRSYLSFFDGELIVLRSQAEKGVNVCEIAIQFNNTSNPTQLVHAHQRSDLKLRGNLANESC